LATLNARRSFSSRLDDSSHMMMSLPATVTSPQVSTASKLQNIAIHINTTKEMNDGDRSILEKHSASQQSEDDL
jgi:hypothetical protein